MTKVQINDQEDFYIDFPWGRHFYNKDGMYHNLNGYAAINNDYYQLYYIDGKRIDVNNDEEFQRYLKLRAFE